MKNRVYLAILEDDPAWSLPMIQAVKQHLLDCVLRTSMDGKSLCRSLSEMPLPCLVILDINTPVMNGFEVLKKIRSRSDLDWLPVVMFSTDNSATTRIDCMAAGATAFYTKPDREIWKTLKEIVDKYSFKGEKPDRLDPPLLAESKPMFTGAKSIDDLLEDL